MMNEKIKQLAEEAGFITHPNTDVIKNNHFGGYMDGRQFEKFAELIVQEYKREWVGLTTDDLKAINDRFHLKGPNIPVAFRTVESTLREKNLTKWDRPCYKCKSLFCDLSCNLDFGVTE